MKKSVWWIFFFWGVRVWSRGWVCARVYVLLWAFSRVLLIKLNPSSLPLPCNCFVFSTSPHPLNIFTLFSSFPQVLLCPHLIAFARMTKEQLSASTTEAVRLGSYTASQALSSPTPGSLHTDVPPSLCPLTFIFLLISEENGSNKYVPWQKQCIIFLGSIFYLDC